MYLLVNCYHDDQIKEHEIDGACGMHRRGFSSGDHEDYCVTTVLPYILVPMYRYSSTDGGPEDTSVGHRCMFHATRCEHPRLHVLKFWVP
jgi:hypothetical protein